MAPRPGGTRATARILGPQRKEQSAGPFPPVPRFGSIPPFNSPPSRDATITRIQQKRRQKRGSCVHAERHLGHGGRHLQPSCSCATKWSWTVELGRQPWRRHRWVHRPRHRRPLVACRRQPRNDGGAAAGLDPTDTPGGEVAVEEGIRPEAGRRRRQWHHRKWRRDGREAPTIPALRPRGGRRRDAQRAPDARWRRHAGREVPAARAASRAVARSTEGRLPLRHAVQCGNVDPALLHPLHEQDERRRKRRGGRCQRCAVKPGPGSADGSFLFRGWFSTHDL